MVDKICGVVSFYITRHGRGCKLCQVTEDILIVRQPRLTRSCHTLLVLMILPPPARGNYSDIDTALSSLLPPLCTTFPPFLPSQVSKLTVINKIRDICLSVLGCATNSRNIRP